MTRCQMWPALWAAFLLLGVEVTVSKKDGLQSSNFDRFVYVDVGANWGNTAGLWRVLGSDRLPDTDMTDLPWEVYLFEAAPMMWPYLDRLTEHLNGNGPLPKAPLPTGGSTPTTVKHFAGHYNCTTAKDKFDCIFRRVNPIMQDLLHDSSKWARYNTSELRQQRLAMAQQPTTGSVRYTLIPAAAGADNEWLRLTWGTKSLLRGGGTAVKRKEGVAETSIYNVHAVDLPAWLEHNFGHATGHKTFLILKMDIEGAEFYIMPKLLNLMAHKRISLAGFAWECHHRFIQNGRAECLELGREVSRHTTLFKERTHYKDFDTEAQPWLKHVQVPK